ncbi:protein-export chaperone SecB [Tatumella citrea]|uniref:Preprotein translocase subunit SecB n=1 Tax=Tatumella citrea TaxID=53336 RepID=A0A1Y0LL62_TATCI|nr:protein-export chaperone SecB [Tatumella citrea]ARU94589.1 hypothetical protein A7K98_12950 [Tatumella citrea]ARU98627.1 hypothetical protein A7K99_12940 [Tatumella citrea]
MPFEVIKFLVIDFSLSPTKDTTKSGKDFDMDVSSSMDFNADNGTDFRIKMTLKLHKGGEFLFKATQMAIVRGDKVSVEDVDAAAKDIPVRSILYPYLRAFTLSTLKTAGYNDVIVPVALLDAAK